MLTYSRGKFYGDQKILNGAAKHIANTHGLKAKMQGSPFTSNYSDENVVMGLAGLLSESTFGTQYKFVRELLCIPNELLLYPGAPKDTRTVYAMVRLKRWENVRMVSALDSDELIALLESGTPFQQLCAKVLTDIRALYLEAIMRTI